MTLYAILWIVGLILAILAIYQTIGLHFMVNFFPEGKRWYQVPFQWLSLVSFATLILFHPF